MSDRITCRHCGHHPSDHTESGCSEPDWSCKCPYTRTELLELSDD